MGGECGGCERSCERLREGERRRRGSGRRGKWKSGKSEEEGGKRREWRQMGWGATVIGSKREWEIEEAVDRE